MVIGRCFHREQRHHFEQVVLDHVSNGADVFVKLSTALDAEGFGHRDLHALNVLAIPDRLEKRIRESKVEEVLDGLLAQVMVDPENLGLWKAAVQHLIQRLRRLEIPPERFFHDHTC